ncbi:hypothetical protein ACHAWX_004012, partial [Stephanocyclus meneghinianus]
MANKGSIPAFDFKDYLEKKDYVGALAVLDSGQCDHLTNVDRLLWIAYCSFRLKHYNRSKDVYLELLSGMHEDAPLEIGLYVAIVHFYLGSYLDAEKAALSVLEDSELKHRILLHISRALGDETKVAKYRQYLRDSKQDALSAAAIELYRGRYKETADVYEMMIAQQRDDCALNVYLAECYFKMDCYDLSLEALSVYSRAFPDSTIAANVKACNMFRLCDAKAALEVLETHCDEKTIRENELIRHNMVVFNEGEKALKVFPGLVHKVPEARLNLAIYYFRNGEIDAADELLDGFDGTCPQSHVVLGILNTMIGQVKRSEEYLKQAQSHFQSVGNSPSERDTILGRQCMVSSLFLLKEYEDAVIYLGLSLIFLNFTGCPPHRITADFVFFAIMVPTKQDSVKPYLANDDSFNWNYGIALAASGKFDEALEALQFVSKESLKSDSAYVLWIAKCWLMNDAPEKAWECLDTDDNATSYELLQLIANECYKIGGHQFLYSARAFNALFDIDKFPDYLNGLTGASVGLFRYLVVRMKGSIITREDLDALTEVIEMLENSSSHKCRNIAKTILKWRTQHACN